MIPPGSSLTDSRLPPIRQTVTLLNEAVDHRVDLAALELDEAGDHALGSLLLLVAAMLLALFGGFAALLTCAVLVWDSAHRDWWLAGICLALLAAAALAGLALRRRLRRWQPLAEFRTQIRQDRACLNRLIKTALP